MVYLFILPEWLGWDKGTLVLLTLMCQWLWWEFTMGVVLLGITVSGWVLYRFRQTRALTMF